MLHGVDVSAYQPGWTPAQNDKFVFVKSTEGSTWTSSQAAAQAKAARDKRLQVGQYHFMRPGNAVRQARWFVAKTDIKPGDLVVCDWENTPEGHPSVADARDFIAEVKRLRPSNRVGLYCNKSEWLNTTVKAGDFLWIAAWNSASSPGISSPWAFWQYSDKPIDQNWANPKWRTLDQLTRWAASTEPAPRWSEEYNAEYVSFAGGRNDWIIPLDKVIILTCAEHAGYGSVRLVQGGLSTNVTDSALTHAGLGVGDIAVDHRRKDLVWDYTAHLNRSGIRAFPRGFGGDPWANKQHVHWGSRENYDHAHPQLQAQIREMESGGDGLRGDGRYNGPRVPLGNWKSSPYNPLNIKSDTSIYVVNVAKGSKLTGLTVDQVPVLTRERGYRVQAEMQVYRWGRWNVVTKTSTYYAMQYLVKEA